MKTIAILAIAILTLSVSGCATTSTTGTTDTASQIAKPDAATILKYANLAITEAAAAYGTYAATQDATSAQKVDYWTKYAQGATAALAAAIPSTVAK